MRNDKEKALNQLSIVVVGGGLSGLTTAYLIKQQIQKLNLAATITLIEKDIRFGGKLWSPKKSGYLCEYGPNGFLPKSETLRLCEDLGINDQLLVSNDYARKRFVYSNHKLHKLPHNLFEFLKSNLLSFSGKLRILGEIFIVKRKSISDESLADFTRRRLGNEALQKLVLPMASGVFAGDPQQMSLKASFSRLYQMEEQSGSLIKALFKLRNMRKKIKQHPIKANNHDNSNSLMSFKSGMQVLIDSLVNAIGADSLLLNTSINQITYLNQKQQYRLLANDKEIVADYLVCATPSYITASLLSNLDEELADNLSRINYSPLIVVCLGYLGKEISTDLNGFGYLLADGEEIQVLGTLWESSIFAKRAPNGRVLFRTMLGGALYPELCALDDSSLQRLVEYSLAQILQIKVKPDLVQIYRHQEAIPAYTLGHCELVSQIMEKVAKHPHLFITGNAYNGVSINDCISNAYILRDKLANSLI